MSTHLNSIRSDGDPPVMSELAHLPVVNGGLQVGVLRLHETQGGYVGALGRQLAELKSMRVLHY